MVDIVEVSTLSDLKAFIRFPFTLYRGNPYWVPPLNFDEMNTLRRDKNPAFEHCQARYWLAYDGGKIVGRVAAILNRKHIEKWNQPYLRFGWIDFIDDAQVSADLLGAVEGWARQENLTAVHGPLGFTDLDREGMLVEGYEELGTMATIYNYPYYITHMEKLGYGKDIDWVEYEITTPEKPDEKIARAAEIVMKRNHLRILPIKNKKELLTHGDDLFHLLDEEYKKLYGTVPLSRRQVDSYIQQYLGFVTPEFVPLVVDANNQLVGFGVALPSLSHALQKAQGELFPLGFIYLMRALQHNERADLYLVAVKSELQGTGVNMLMIHTMSQVLLKLGVRKVETNPELETNLAVQSMWKFYQTRQHKRRRCFIKHLV